MRCLSLQSSIVLISLAGLFACKQENSANHNPAPPAVEWSARHATLPAADQLSTGSTYLSVYSEIYAQSQHRTYPLTATVSMRNLSTADTVYLRSATYYNTAGRSIRSYLSQPIYLAPMETLEIVIEEADTEGGSGANFIFDWAVPLQAPEPYFEAVMISTSGQQGLSFTTRGVER